MLAQRAASRLSDQSLCPASAEKAKQNRYTSVAQVKADAELIIANAEKYNDAESGGRHCTPKGEQEVPSMHCASDARYHMMHPPALLCLCTHPKRA